MHVDFLLHFVLLLLSLQVENLARKYDQKFKAAGEFSSRLQAEEAAFRDIQVCILFFPPPSTLFCCLELSIHDKGWQLADGVGGPNFQVANTRVKWHLRAMVFLTIANMYQYIFE